VSRICVKETNVRRRGICTGVGCVQEEWRLVIEADIRTSKGRLRTEEIFISSLRLAYIGRLINAFPGFPPFLSLVWIVDC
jgi:hypothetical protein